VIRVKFICIGYKIANVYRLCEKTAKLRSAIVKRPINTDWEYCGCLMPLQLSCLSKYEEI